MEIKTERFKHCDLVRVSGRIDSQTSPQLAEALDTLMDANRFKIVLDMQEVDFVSSAGLRVLIDVQKKCKNRGELVLAAVPERIYEALDMAGFVPLFKIENDVLHAVGDF